MALPQVISPRIANFPIIRDSQGELTNPTTSTLLADSGPIGEESGGTGVYEVLILASATATAEFVVQHRNNQNNQTVGDAVIFYTPANVPVPVPMRFFVDKGDRIRVLPNASLTGDAVVNIFLQRVA